MKLDWKDGFGSLYKGVKAEDVVAELSKINSDAITPEQVLDAARDENSLLHQFFEWDDSVAAEKYRKSQAQQMLLKITYVTDDEDTKPKRYFHNISYSTGEYHPVEFIFKHEDAYEMLKKRAIDYLRVAQNKFAEVKELQAVWDAIQQVLDDVA